jgi:glycosyltransferase involved in cell wall biosynthesis
VIVGDGPKRRELEQLTSSLGIVKQVHFLGTRSDTVAILSALNVFCLTSNNEANPVSILEALSVGIPVVATDVGSVSLTVQPGITGFLSKPGDESEFTDHTVSLLEDRRLASTLGANGREEVIAKWSLQGMVRGYEDLITAIYRGKTVSGEPMSEGASKSADYAETRHLEHSSK